MDLIYLKDSHRVGKFCTEAPEDYFKFAGRFEPSTLKLKPLEEALANWEIDELKHANQLQFVNKQLRFETQGLHAALYPVRNSHAPFRSWIQ
jgi:hypothetical protein